VIFATRFLVNNGHRKGPPANRQKTGRFPGGQCGRCRLSGPNPTGRIDLWSRCQPVAFKAILWPQARQSGGEQIPMPSKTVANLSLYSGITLLIFFGYFATIKGGSTALHSFYGTFAVGALACGAVYSNTRSRPAQTQVAQPKIGSSKFSKFSTYASIGAAILFFVEVNLPSLWWREALGGLSLAMYAISLAMAIKVRGRASSIEKSPLS
jgi:hypothetical protein